MNVTFIKSDTVLKGAAQCFGTVEHLLPDDQKQVAFDALREAMKKILDEYETRMDRMVSRVQPSKN